MPPPIAPYIPQKPKVETGASSPRMSTPELMIMGAGGRQQDPTKRHLRLNLNDLSIFLSHH
jgi:hypothetical protein